METKVRILEKASILFLTLGVKNVTMDSLATKLGISKRTIYEHFRDKDTLVIECMRHMIVEDNIEQLKIIDSTENVIEAMFLITRRLAKRNQEFPKIFLEDIKKYFPAVNELLFSCRDNFRKFSASYNLLEKGIAQGVFRNDLNIELVDSFFHEIISIMHTSERIRVLGASQNDLLYNIFLPYIRGICSSKGFSLIEKYFERQTNK